MNDYDKIIKGFTCCYPDTFCEQCPYEGVSYCTEILAMDMGKLIQEQHNTKQMDFSQHMDGNGNNRTCTFLHPYKGKWRDGLFHCWTEVSKTDVDGSKLRAVVEDTATGVVYYINVYNIRFKKDGEQNDTRQRESN